MKAKIRRTREEMTQNTVVGRRVVKQRRTGRMGIGAKELENAERKMWIGVRTLERTGRRRGVGASRQR